MPNRPVDPLVSIGRVAELTGLRVYTLQQEADAGALPCVRVGRGRYRRFRTSTVLAYCVRIGIVPSDEAFHVESSRGTR